MRAIVATLAAALLALALAALLIPSSAPEQERAAPEVAAPGPSPEPAQPDIAAPSPPLPLDHVARLQVPTSMAGAEIDGAVNLDGDGNVLIDLELRRLFDHVLSSAGELSIDAIRALLAERLKQLTTPRAAAQALEIFERYLRYLREAHSAGPRLEGLALDARLEALRELRRSVLGEPMAEAFFGMEERYQAHTLAVRDLDPGLAPEERARREQALIEQLPAELRAPILEHQRTQADLQDAAAIASAAVGADERYALRRERFGEAAAARMELLDRELATWQSRVQAYQQQRQQLGADDPALARYLREHFSEPEQRRILSLEAIGEL